jgi:hypothetical protein
MYKGHPLAFTEEVTERSINGFDRGVVFHALYRLPQGVRDQDVDHIQPCSLLRQNPDYESIINVVENYQLLDVGTNRGVKSAKPLDEWICNDVRNREVYLEKHFIPHDQDLWRLERYKDFISARRSILIRELKARLYIQET